MFSRKILFLIILSCIGFSGIDSSPFFSRKMLRFSHESASQKTIQDKSMALLFLQNRSFDFYSRWIHGGFENLYKRNDLLFSTGYKASANFAIDGGFFAMNRVIPEVQSDIVHNEAALGFSFYSEDIVLRTLISAKNDFFLAKYNNYYYFPIQINYVSEKRVYLERENSLQFVTCLNSTWRPYIGYQFLLSKIQSGVKVSFSKKTQIDLSLLLPSVKNSSYSIKAGFQYNYSTIRLRKRANSNGKSTSFWGFPEVKKQKSQRNFVSSKKKMKRTGKPRKVYHRKVKFSHLISLGLSPQEAYLLQKTANACFLPAAKRKKVIRYGYRCRGNR